MMTSNVGTNTTTTITVFETRVRELDEGVEVLGGRGLVIDLLVYGYKGGMRGVRFANHILCTVKART